jgi:hypothetical protein
MSLDSRALLFSSAISFCTACPVLLTHGRQLQRYVVTATLSNSVLLLTRWKISGIERCENFLIAQRLSGRNYEEACGSTAARVLEPEMMEPETPGGQLFESGFDCAGEMAEQCPALPCCDLHASLTTRSAGNSAAVARASAGSQAESGSPFSGGWPVSVVGPTSSGTAS